MAWPKGKRRNTRDESRVRAELARIADLIDRRHTGTRPPPGRRTSRRAAAAACGVDTRTLIRWLAGVDLPRPRALARLRLWAAGCR